MWDTSLSIPNRVIKPHRADGTAFYCGRVGNYNNDKILIDMNPNVHNTHDRNLNFYHANPDISEDTPIYKIMEFEYAYTMIKDKALNVGKLKSWEDPFENFLLKQNFWYKDTNGERKNCDIHEISELLYGQSWSLTEESDAMRSEEAHV